MKQNPEPVDTNGGGDPAWETLSTAIRIYGSWLETWFSLQESPSFRPRTRIDMLKSFRAHARHLLQYQGGPNNWIVVESRALAMLGMLFPEFEEAEEWREEGVRRLTRELHRQVYPDGVQYETSPGYHSMSALGFCDVFRLARMNGIALDPLFARRLEGMFDYVMHATRPDGTWPSLNDSGGCRGRRRAGFLDLGAELFKRPDMAWVASSGGRGRRPRRLSRTFEDAGIMVMRTGWTRSDKYLIFDGGPFAAAHQHEDKLSFELCSDGTLFIVDPGISSYMREPWTHYYRSPEAHNTVLVDGRGQDRRNRQSRDEHIRSVRGENVWFIGKAYDCIRAEYGAGFAGLDEKVVHRRSVLFLKPDYWLVWDELLGDSPRGIEALYHFMPMRLQVDGEKGRVRTDRLGKANLEMIALPRPERFDVSVVTGRRDPVQGWISDGEDIPAPVVVLAAREALPFSFGAAFVPYATGNSAGVEVSVLSPSAFRLTFKNGRKDTFFVRGAGEQAATDAEIAVLREDAKGGLVSAFRVGGSFVGRRGERVPIPTSGPAAEFVSPQK